MKQQVTTENSNDNNILQDAVQYVYLDFDGELTTYRNNILDITIDVDIKSSGMSEEQKCYILTELSRKYENTNICFTIEKPENNKEYSTVFIGKTDDFDEYGSFAGIAETIDKGNQIKNDNAFVFADFTSDLDCAVSVIEHEVGHIVLGEEHEITVNSLQDYMATYTEREFNGYDLYSISWKHCNLGTVSGTTVVNASYTEEDFFPDDLFRFSPSESGNAVLKFTKGDSLLAEFYDCSYFGSAGCAFGYALNTTRYIYRTFFSGETLNFAVTAGMTYYIRISSSVRTEQDYQLTLELPGSTGPASDDQAPTVPDRLTHEISGYDVVFDWANSTDNIGVTGYEFSYSTNSSFYGAQTYYPSSSNYELNNLSDGTYYWRVRAKDAAGNYSSWSSSKTFDISSGDISSGNSDLSFYIPSGWSDKLIVSTETGRYTDSDLFTEDDTIYLDFAVINQGAVYTDSSVYVDIYVDGEFVDYWPYSAGLDSYGCHSWEDKSIGKLSAGQHTIELQIRHDALETATDNNSYSKTIYVSQTQQTNVKIYQSDTLTSQGNNITGAILGYGTDDSMYVSSGGVVNGTIINEGGIVNIYNGGTANSTTVNDGGELYVSHGGIALGTTINPGGWGYVSSNGTASSTIINDSFLIVSNGGIANNSVINEFGFLYVESGGIADNSVINEDGFLYVENTGSAKNITINASYLYVESGGISDNSVMNGYGYIYVENKGSAKNTIVNEGEFNISSGGTADTLQLHSGGYMYLYAGAILKGEIKAGGEVIITTDETSATEDVIRANGAKINYLVSERTTEDISIITDLGMIMGATYYLTIQNFQEKGIYRLADGAEDFNGSITVCTESGISLGSVSVGGTGNRNGYSYKLYQDSGTLYFDLLSAPEPVNYYRGNSLISSAKVLSDKTVSANEKIYVSNGGVVTSTGIYSGGTVILSSGALSDKTDIYNGGGLHVFSGAAASGTTVYQGGYFGVGDGARTYDTTIELFGALTVWSGGIVTGNTVNSKGSLILSSGAVADQSVINGGGGLHVFSGAAASNTTVEQNGFFGVGLGATTYNTTIGYAGSLTVWGGGVVHVNEINQWGAIILSSGAVANSTTINPGGGLNIFKGAAAYTTTITSGAFLGIGGGGTLYSGDLENTATMAFYNGSILRGWVDAEGTILTSGTVDAAGTYINFELGDRVTYQGPILDNMNHLTGVKRYSVEVETDQTAGTYELAGGANGFSGELTLYVGNGNDCGTLAVGTCLDYNGKQYCLERTNGVLALRIA